MVLMLRASRVPLGYPERHDIFSLKPGPTYHKIVTGVFLMIARPISPVSCPGLRVANLIKRLGGLDKVTLAVLYGDSHSRPSPTSTLRAAVLQKFLSAQARTIVSFRIRGMVPRPIYIVATTQRPERILKLLRAKQLLSSRVPMETLPSLRLDSRLLAAETMRSGSRESSGLR